MKKFIGILLIGLLTFGNAWAGSFSTGAIDTVARANAATAQATANAAEPTASLPAYLASPPPIGGTTPAAGTFLGSTSSAAACAGCIGENLFVQTASANGAGNSSVWFVSPSVALSQGWWNLKARTHLDITNGTTTYSRFVVCLSTNITAGSVPGDFCKDTTILSATSLGASPIFLDWDYDNVNIYCAATPCNYYAKAYVIYGTSTAAVAAQLYAIRFR